MKLLKSNLKEFLTVPLLYLRPNNTVSEALWGMVSTNTTSLPVVDDDYQLVGQISLVDVVGLQTKIIQHFSDNHDELIIPTALVKNVMTSPVISVQISDQIKKVIKFLSNRHILSNPSISERKRFISSLPVLDNNYVIGTISYIDILRKIDPENTLVSEVASTAYIPVLEETHTLEVAYDLLTSRGERNVLVLNKNKTPIGVVTDLQILRHMRQKRDFSNHSVKIAMSDITIYSPIKPQDGMQKVLSLFTNPSFPFRIIPIIDKNQLYGVVDVIDILKLMDNRLSSEHD